MIKTAKFILPLLVLSLSVIGCGGGGKGPSTVKISGVLEIGGQTAGKDIQLTLAPSSESGLETASARTTEGGKFTFFTGQTATPGVMPGKYKVVAISTSSDDESRMNDSSRDDSDNPEEAGGGNAASSIPERFGSAKTSDLEVTVEKADTNFSIKIPAQ